MRTCNACGYTYKDVASNFYKTYTKVGGYRKVCKKCVAIARKNGYTPVKRQAINKRYKIKTFGWRYENAQQEHEIRQQYLLSLFRLWTKKGGSFTWAVGKYINQK